MRENKNLYLYKICVSLCIIIMVSHFLKNVWVMKCEKIKMRENKNIHIIPRHTENSPKKRGNAS